MIIELSIFIIAKVLVMSGKRLAGRHPFTQCLPLQWTHQRCHRACIMAKRETLTPNAESALLPITVPSVVHKKGAPECAFC
jgi:hypothetical protein